MAPNRRNAEAILVDLYNSGTPFLDEYPWEHEHDRWKELLLCLLVAGLQIEADRAKTLLDALDGLGLVTASSLATSTKADRDLVLQVMLRHGIERAVAVSAVNALARLGQMAYRQYEGHFQRFLRDHGRAITEDLSKRLGEALGLDAKETEKVAVLWLQRVANLPLLLPRDPHITAFCKTHGLTAEALVEAADRLGLNISVLDDLLALEAMARPSKGSKRISRG